MPNGTILSFQSFPAELNMMDQTSGNDPNVSNRDCSFKRMERSSNYRFPMIRYWVMGCLIANLFYEFKGFLELELSMSYFKGNLINFSQLLCSMIVIFLLVKSYSGNLRLIYYGLIIVSIKNAAPFFGLSIYVDDDRYAESGHAVSLRHVTMVSGFFHSFVIALCF